MSEVIASTSRCTDKANCLRKAVTVIVPRTLRERWAAVARDSRVAKARDRRLWSTPTGKAPVEPRPPPPRHLWSAHMRRHIPRRRLSTLPSEGWATPVDQPTITSAPAAAVPARRPPVASSSRLSSVQNQPQPLSSTSFSNGPPPTDARPPLPLKKPTASAARRSPVASTSNLGPVTSPAGGSTAPTASSSTKTPDSRRRACALLNGTTAGSSLADISLWHNQIQGAASRDSIQ